MPQRVPKGRVELKPAQERVLALLAEDGSGRLTRGRYEEITGVSRSQAAYDLAELVDAGILERVGGGRATTYRLIRRARSAGQRHWTNERIRAGLVDFCAGRKTWPSASEFKADGRSDLYVAASRYGGIGFWATELGFAKPSRPTAQQVAPRSWRPRLRWATGGVAIAAALSAAAGTVVVRGDAPAHDAAARRSAAGSAPVLQSAPARPELKVRSRTATAKTKATPARQLRRHPRASSRSKPSAGAPSSHQAELVVAKVSTPTSSSVSAPRREVAQQTTSARSGGPAPLPPPPASGTPPAPLPPPEG